MIKTIKCDYCHGQNAIRLSFPGGYTWYDEATIDSSTGLSDEHEVYVCKDCGKVMLKKVRETLEIVEKILDAEGVPIEVGDTVYYITGLSRKYIKSANVNEIIINCNGISELFVSTDTVNFENSFDAFYLTREEAERELKERENNG